MTREVDCIIAYVAAAKIPGLYPGYTTNGSHSPGSRHEQKGTHSAASGDVGLAVDFDAPGNNPAALLACAKWLDKARPQLFELFHTPLGYSVKGGVKVSWFVSDHVTHVHVSVSKGVFLQVPNSVPTPSPQPTPEDEEMIQYEFDDGAIIAVNAQGEVFCPEYPNRPTARHLGGMTQLRDDAKVGFGKAVSIAGLDRQNSQGGYVIKDQRWTKDGFKFDPTTLKQFGK